MQAYCELYGLQPRHSSLRYWDLGNYNALDAERKVHNDLELRRISLGGTREVFAIGNRSYDEIRNQMDRILSPYASSTNYRVNISGEKSMLAVDLGYGLALAAMVTFVVWAL